MSSNMSQHLINSDKSGYSAHVPQTPRPSGTRAATRLTLAEEPSGPAYAALWIGALVALGARAWRYSRQLEARQLVIAITAPRRDFAAALVGCGWTMVHPAPDLGRPIDVLRGLAEGTPVRLVTDQFVVTGEFLSLDESKDRARVQLRGSMWFVDVIKALSVLPERDQAERAKRPVPGSAGHIARLEDAWDSRLACPPGDLALVGTLAWLHEDAACYLALEGAGTDAPSQLSTLLLPKGMQRATWSTRLYSSAGFADQLPLPAGIRAVVLDGFGAIRYIGEIDAPVVICVIDRSVADETAAEIIVQLRNTGSTPVPMGDLGWQSVLGIEALAFTVPL
jgi:hypothetical protein